MTLSISVRATVVAIMGLLLLPAVTFANSDCSFTRTLSLGDEGSDVLCLQKFLNTNGFQIASVGVGSPGRETTTYGSLTTAAVLRFQKASTVSGANGNFGPATQAAYRSFTPVVASAVTPSASPELQALVAGLQDQLQQGLAEAGAQPLAVGATPQVAGIATTAQADAIKALVELVEQLQDIDDDLTADNASDLHTSLTDVRLNMYNGLLKFFAGEYTSAEKIASAVLDDAEDVLDDMESLSEEDEAIEALEDARDRYDDLRDEQDAAEEDGDDVSDLDDYLDEADDYLDDAEDAIDAGDYDDALDLIDDAEDAMDDAEDEL